MGLCYTGRMLAAAHDPIQIGYLADFPQHLPELAGWLYAEWGQPAPDGSVQMAQESLRRRLNKDRLPLALVAVQGETLLGTTSLYRQEMEIRPEYEFWLSTVYVHPSFRRRGIGEQLVQAAAAQAVRLGLPALYLYTRRPNNVAWYTRLGWTILERPIYEGSPAVIMVRQLDTANINSQAPPAPAGA